MSEVDDNSVDLIPTDPPYGLSFMGKQWDKALPPIEIWRECLRVLKPGAFAFVMSSTRQDCLARMIISLEDAGFKIGFTSLYWAYPSGFPKAQNIAKAIEKRHREPDRIDNVKGCGGMISDKGYNVTKHHLIYNEFITPPAKALDGSYSFNPKPATEIILVCQKPMKHKTYVDQALDWQGQREQVLSEVEIELKKQGVEKVEWENE